MADLKIYFKGSNTVVEYQNRKVVSDFDIITETNGTYTVIDRHKESNSWNVSASELKDESGVVISDLNTYLLNNDVLQNIADAVGSTSGNTSTVNKFGYNIDIDTGTEEIVASFGGAYDPSIMVMSTAQTFTIAYNNTTDGASGTGARMLQFSYIDENFEAQTAFHVLGSSGSDVTSFTGLGINRVVVVQFGGDIYNNNDITITATTDTTIQAQIPAQKSVTQQCIYHTPINRTLDLNYVKISTLKLSGGGGSPTVHIRAYSYSRVTGGRYGIWDMNVDTSVENNIEFNMPNPITFTGREVIFFTGETDINNTKLDIRFSGTEKDS